MDDGEVILIAPDNKNQDGSQTYFILDPCSSEDCVDGPTGIELIDLTDEYQVENTGAIAVVSTSSTGALEITLKKSKEDMDPKQLSGMKEVGGNIEGSREDDAGLDVITDDDTVRDVKFEEEDIDVEDIGCQDFSIGSEQKSEPESINISDVEEEQQESQNDQDDDTEEGVLFIDDAKYTELQEELVPENIQEQNNLKEHVVQQIDCTRQVSTKNMDKVPDVTINPSSDNTDDLTIVDVIENKSEQLENVITMSFDVVSGPISPRTPNQTVSPQVALIHGHMLELPSRNKSNIDKPTNEMELTDSTNTALTLLELAGSTSAPLKIVDNHEIYDSQSSVHKLVKEVVSTVEETRIIQYEPTLTTLQPVQLDPPTPSIIVSDNPNIKATDNVQLDPPTPSIIVSDNPNIKATDTVQLNSPTPSIIVSDNPNIKATDTVPLTVPEPPSKNKTDVSSTPKAPVIRITPEELLQRLKDGDTPRQLLGKESGRRGRETLYISPLVTRAEIAQEFMDRQLQKNPYTEPAGGDYIFAMKLAHRLATKIVTPETAVQQLEEGKDESKEDGNITGISQSSLSLDNNINSLSHTESDKESKKNYAMSDKIELLKILEDDPDDPASSSDTSQVILEQKVKPDRKKSTNAPLIKMHPELERELALKQLQDFTPGNGRSCRKKVSFIPDSKMKLEKGLERNNNLNSSKKSTNGMKKRPSETVAKPTKKMKKEDVTSLTADPKQITETLTDEGQIIADDPSTKDGKSLKQYSNKRLSRSSETPPRDLPMDIVLNGIDDPPTETSTTNKIFKATNPRKRKAELQEKRQKQITNVFHTNKPQKRRGRPPKRKLYPTNDELNKKFLLNATLETNNGAGADENHQDCQNQNICPDTEEKPIKTKKMREIERLLGDEGAINMLYSVEQKRASGGESKRGMLPSYRRKKKDLILKTKLVKSAVLRLTTNPPLSVGRISLRGQTPKEEVESSDKNSFRKMSVDSHDSRHSLSSPPPESFPFPAKIVPAEASRIIRRHSSSSNYSSRSNSPRRQSVDGERVIISQEEKAIEAEQIDSSSSSTNNIKHKQVKTPQQSPVETNKNSNDRSDRAIAEKSRESKDFTPKTNHSVECKKQPNSIKSKPKSTDNTESPRLRGRRRIFVNSKSKIQVELNTSLAAAAEDFAKENKSGGKNIPEETPKKLSKSAVPNRAVYKKSTDTTRTRTPKPSKVYRELTLKRHDLVVEISLTPISTKLQNAFNANVLQELTSVLTGLSKDDNCHVVLITSQGTVFCQGVDFPALIKPTPEQRKAAAFEMVVAIKDFVKSVAVLARPVVAAVHAPAVGLGVTLLPLCDVVLANQDATFHTPYTRLGQVPEGAATLTFPTLLGPAATSELLFACRKYTSSEAQQADLVTRLLPSENFHEEALAIAKSLSSHSSQAMNETKVLLRHSLLMGLETTLMSESHLLTKHWVTAECQANFTSALEKGEYVLAVTSTSTSTSTSTDKDGPK